MQWRTVILDSNNWIIGEHSIKEVMHWAIQDRPWYTLRTFTIDTPIVCPMQLKQIVGLVLILTLEQYLL